jgi:RES domain-containing protein
MHLWRISNYRSLDGQGGLKYPGRWHTAGRPVVYLAESPAGALLEVLAHLALDPDDVPDTFTLLRVQLPASSAIEKLSAPRTFNWRTDQTRTQLLGDRWLRTAKSALARVPSALLPETFNYLLNPLHPDASQIKITQVFEERYDLRLTRRLHPG